MPILNLPRLGKSKSDRDEDQWIATEPYECRYEEPSDFDAFRRPSFKLLASGSAKVTAAQKRIYRSAGVLVPQESDHEHGKEVALDQPQMPAARYSLSSRPVSMMDSIYSRQRSVSDFRGSTLYRDPRGSTVSFSSSNLGPLEYTRSNISIPISPAHQQGMSMSPNPHLHQQKMLEMMLHEQEADNRRRDRMKQEIENERPVESAAAEDFKDKASSGTTNGAKSSVSSSDGSIPLSKMDRLAQEILRIHEEETARLEKIKAAPPISGEEELSLSRNNRRPASNPEVRVTPTEGDSRRVNSNPAIPEHSYYLAGPFFPTPTNSTPPSPKTVPDQNINIPIPTSFFQLPPLDFSSDISLGSMNNQPARSGATQDASREAAESKPLSPRPLETEEHPRDCSPSGLNIRLSTFSSDSDVSHNWTSEPPNEQEQAHCLGDDHAIRAVDQGGLIPVAAEDYSYDSDGSLKTTYSERPEIRQAEKGEKIGFGNAKLVMIEELRKRARANEKMKRSTMALEDRSLRAVASS